MTRSQKKYLFIISTSYGHLFPAVRLAKLLQEQHQEVLFVTDRQYQLLFDLNGIQSLFFEGKGNPFLATADWYNSEVASDSYRQIAKVIDAYQPDNIVCSQLTISAFVLAECFKLPLTVMGYTEYMFPAISEQQSKKQWRIESFTGHYNNLRIKLGMPPVTPCAETTPLLGDKYLLRSVPQFTTREYWPDKVEYVGGLLWSPKNNNLPLLGFINLNLERQRPLFVMQIGRLFEELDKWPVLIKILSNLDADFIIDLARADYLTSHQTFPDNIFAQTFVDIGSIEKHLSGIICTGQSTSVLSALCYGKPILAIPNSGDGAELGERIINKQLGYAIQNAQQLCTESFQHFINAVSDGKFEPQNRAFQSHFQEYEDQQSLYKRCFE